MHLGTGKVLKIKADVAQASANWNLKLLVYHICGIHKMYLTKGKVLNIKVEVAQAGANWNLKLLVYHICRIHKHFWVQD